MALQGDLKSFALPDVLRLLAGTGKSGHLEVSGSSGTGAVRLHEGAISWAASSTAPRADDPADVIFQLLRFEDGAFVFDEGDVPDEGLRADVESTIVQAEALVVEWSEIEAVIPGMEAWITLSPEVLSDIVVTVDQWRTLAAIGGGGNVHDLAAALDLSDLEASRRVVDLVQTELAMVRTSPGYEDRRSYEPPAVELTDFEDYEAYSDHLEDPLTDIEDLVVEDRPVVMEDRDDALLPEPLPGEGVAYEGETITGVVDGRTFDSLDDLELEPAHDLEPMVEQVIEAPIEPPMPEPTDGFEAFESLASFEEAAAMSDLAGEPGTIDGFGDADPFPESVAAADEFVSEISAEADDEPADAPAVDDERDSLLKFLSSVKP